MRDHRYLIRRLNRFECLDYYTGTIHSVAAVVVHVLCGLPDSVVPMGLFDLCITRCENKLLCKELLKDMPMSHYNTFVYIMSFLRSVVSKSMYNGMNAEAIGKFDYLCRFHIFFDS